MNVLFIIYKLFLIYLISLSYGSIVDMVIKIDKTE